MLVYSCICLIESVRFESGRIKKCRLIGGLLMKTKVTACAIQK